MTEKDYVYEALEDHHQLETIILEYVYQHFAIACDRLRTLSERRPEDDAVQELYLKALELDTQTFNYIEHAKYLAKERENPVVTTSESIKTSILERILTDLESAIDILDQVISRKADFSLIRAKSKARESVGLIKSKIEREQIFAEAGAGS